MYIYLVQYYIAIFYPKVSTNMNVLRIIKFIFPKKLTDAPCPNSCFSVVNCPPAAAAWRGV